MVFDFRYDDAGTPKTYGCDFTNEGYCENVKQKACFKEGYNACLNEKNLKTVNELRL